MVKFRKSGMYLKTLKFISMLRIRNTWKVLSNDMTFYNGTGTSNRHPCIFNSWIEYWRGMTETYNDDLRCCSGNCRISCNLSDDEIKINNENSSNETIRKACGAHVEVIMGSELYYIAPMCDKCNKEGLRVVIKAGTKVVPEIAPKIIQI